MKDSIEDRFLDYLDGRLSEAEQREFEAALERDAGLRRTFEQYRAIVRLESARASAPTAARTGLTAAIMAQLESEPAPWHRRLAALFHGPGRMVAITAVLLMTVTIAYRAWEEQRSIVPAAAPLHEQRSARPARIESAQAVIPAEPQAKEEVAPGTLRDQGFQNRQSVVGASGGRSEDAVSPNRSSSEGEQAAAPGTDGAALPPPSAADEKPLFPEPKAPVDPTHGPDVRHEADAESAAVEGAAPGAESVSKKGFAAGIPNRSAAPGEPRQRAEASSAAPHHRLGAAGAPPQKAASASIELHIVTSPRTPDEITIAGALYSGEGPESAAATLSFPAGFFTWLQPEGGARAAVGAGDTAAVLTVSLKGSGYTRSFSITGKRRKAAIRGGAASLSLILAPEQVLTGSLILP